jgi:hypothetical protein
VARRQTLAARVRHFFDESTALVVTGGSTPIWSGGHGMLSGTGPPDQARRGPGHLPTGPFRVAADVDAEAAAKIPYLVKRDFSAIKPDVKCVGYG